MSQTQTRGLTRRHRFFCTSRERHADDPRVIDVVPKEIVVLGRRVSGWLITTEEPVIDKFISLDEAMQGDLIVLDPE